MNLFQVKDDVQRTAEVIASVLEIDVTIIDNNLYRVAATGRYIDQIGDQINNNSAFSKAIRNKEFVVIDKDSSKESCNNCERVGFCLEHGCICYPIILENTCIGVIGLIAFSMEQKNILLKRKKYLLDFLEKMSGLLVSKLLENKRANELVFLTKQLEIILDSYDNGIIFVNSQGFILRHNKVVSDMFKLKKIEIDNLNIEELLPQISIKKILMEKKNTRNQEFNYKSNKVSVSGIYSVKFIMNNDEILGLLFTFRFIKEIIDTYNYITSDGVEIGFNNILGNSRSLLETKQKAMVVSNSNSTVLILGESGTGKDLFARAIHYNSSRRNKPYVAINCAAIPENLLESELFGYEDGAFTGARKGGKIGKFELANNGTIFLDEIGDLQLNLQAKLLRVLQDRKVERIGGSSPIPIDVRIITATNKNLEEKIKLGEFRQDLFYRLSVIPIEIESLRNRREDIMVIAKYLLEQFSYKMNKDVSRFSEEVVNLFNTYEWPGNVRELENTIEYSINMTNDNEIGIDDLPARFKDIKSLGNNFIDKNIRRIRDIEKDEIDKAIKVYGTDIHGMKELTRSLGLSRASIYRKIKEYNIEI